MTEHAVLEEWFEVNGDMKVITGYWIFISNEEPDGSVHEQYFVIPTKPEDGTQLNDCTKDALKKIKKYGRYF